jgi:hypothetical protein
MYAVAHGAPNDHTDLLAFLDPVEAVTMEVQAESRALRPRRAFSKTPYFTPLGSIILLV